MLVSNDEEMAEATLLCEKCSYGALAFVALP